MAALDTQPGGVGYVEDRGHCMDSPNMAVSSPAGRCWIRTKNVVHEQHGTLRSGAVLLFAQVEN